MAQWRKACSTASAWHLNQMCSTEGRAADILLLRSCSLTAAKEVGRELSLYRVAVVLGVRLLPQESSSIDAFGVSEGHSDSDDVDVSMSSFCEQATQLLLVLPHTDPPDNAAGLLPVRCGRQSAGVLRGFHRRQTPEVGPQLAPAARQVDADGRLHRVGCRQEPKAADHLRKLLG